MAGSGLPEAGSGWLRLPRGWFRLAKASQRLAKAISKLPQAVQIQNHFKVAQMDGWMDGWMNGQTDGWTDGWNFPPVFYRTLSPIGSAALPTLSLGTTAYSRPRGPLTT